MKLRSVRRNDSLMSVSRNMRPPGWVAMNQPLRTKGQGILGVTVHLLTVILANMVKAIVAARAESHPQ